MIDRDAEEKLADNTDTADQTRAWYAQVASIANSILLLTVLVMGFFVAYIIGDMRSDLHDVTAKLRADAPALHEKELVIKELREESAQLKARVEQLQKDVARASISNTENSSTNKDKKGERLSEAGSNLADCINAVLNGKGSPDDKCAGKGPGGLVLKSQG